MSCHALCYGGYPSRVATQVDHGTARGAQLGHRVLEQERGDGQPDVEPHHADRGALARCDGRGLEVDRRGRQVAEAHQLSRRRLTPQPDVLLPAAGTLESHLHRAADRAFEQAAQPVDLDLALERGILDATDAVEGAVERTAVDGEETPADGDSGA